MSAATCIIILAIIAASLGAEKERRDKMLIALGVLALFFITLVTVTLLFLSLPKGW